jgi:NitT/TauT family transport system substrate-binding protein
VYSARRAPRLLGVLGGLVLVVAACAPAAAPPVPTAAPAPAKPAAVATTAPAPAKPAAAATTAVPTSAAPTVAPAPPKPTLAPQLERANLKVQGYTGLNLSWLTQVADAKGFFQKNGITIEFVPTTSGAQALAALLSDSVDTSVCDPTICLPAVEKGEELQAFVGQVGSLVTLVVRKDAEMPNLNKPFPENFRDLQGKTVGVAGIGGLTYYLLLSLMQAAGMPDGSIQWTPSGGPPESIAALTSGRIDAWVAYGPGRTMLLESGDAKVLLDLDNPGTNFDQFPEIKALTSAPQGAIWAKKSWIEQHPRLVEQYRLAIMQADVWMHDPKNLDEFVTLFKDKWGAPGGVDAARYVRDNINTSKSYFAKDGAQRWLDFVIKYKVISTPVPVEQWVAAGTPQTPAEVKQRVEQAGGI